MADGLWTIARTKRILIVCTIGWLLLFGQYAISPMPALQVSDAVVHFTIPWLLGILTAQRMAICS